MNTETTYQNQDLENQNPLVPTEKTKNQTENKSNQVNLPKDPKLKILVILAVIVFILIIISIITGTIKKNNITIPSQPTPTPYNTPAPDDPDGTGYTSIPENYKNKFDEIDKKIRTDIDFSPPQITDDIGR